MRIDAVELAVAHHVETEETLLFPHIPAGARWNERLYCLEHDRIRLHADEYAALLDDAAASLPQGDQARRVVILAMLDHAHSPRHLLEHHHRREEMALADELPSDLQARAWGHEPSWTCARGPPVPGRHWSAEKIRRSI